MDETFAGEERLPCYPKKDRSPMIRQQLSSTPRNPLPQTMSSPCPRLFDDCAFPRLPRSQQQHLDVPQIREGELLELLVHVICLSTKQVFSIAALICGSVWWLVFCGCGSLCAGQIWWVGDATSLFRFRQHRRHHHQQHHQQTHSTVGSATIYLGKS